MDTLSEGSGIIKKAANINHRIIDNEEHNNEDLKSIEILNSQINGGRFFNVDISNSDLFSTKLNSIGFQNVEFKYSDINSIWASKCTFEHVAFDGSTLNDSTFIDCKFIDCSFSHIGMTNNQFINCEIRKYFADHCTITLNEFIGCSLIDLKLCSTFYYQIFDNCIFKDVIIKEELLGFNYGILHATNSFSVDIIHDLKSEFINKGLLLNAAIAEINYNEESLNLAMLACLLTISRMLSKDLIIKSDELIFVMKLLEYFYEKKLIAPICVIECWKIVYELQQEQLTNSAYNKALENITKLKNFLYICYEEFLSDLSNSIKDLPQLGGVIELEMHYHEKPKIEITTIIEAIISKCHLSIPKPVLLHSSEGSFMEWIKTNSEIVPYIQALISLLGVAVSLIKKVKNKDTVDNQDNKNTVVNEREQFKKATQGIQVAKTQIIVPVFIPERNQKIEEMASQVFIVTLENNFVGSPDYLGYGNKNIININVNYTL